MKLYDVAERLSLIDLPAFLAWAEKEIQADHQRVKHNRRDWTVLDLPYMDYAKTVVPEVEFRASRPSFHPSFMWHPEAPTIKWLVPWSIETEANQKWEKFLVRIHRTYRDKWGDDVAPFSWTQFATVEDDNEEIVRLPVARYLEEPLANEKAEYPRLVVS